MKDCHLVANVRACARIVSHRVMTRGHPLLEGSARTHDMYISVHHLCREVLSKARQHFTVSEADSQRLSGSSRSCCPSSNGAVFLVCCPEVTGVDSSRFVTCPFSLPR